MKPSSSPVVPRHRRRALPAGRVRSLLLLAAVMVLSLAVPDLASTATKGRIVLYNKAFRCGSYSQPLRLTLLRVTMRNRNGNDAVGLNRGNCRGYIGRIEVTTWARDGIKVGRTAHDLVIASGFVRCYGRTADVHQDAIQVMGGRRIRFRRIVTRCRSSNHSSFFVNAGKGNPRPPAYVTCNRCNLKGGGTTVHIGRAIRSGVMNSVVYAGRHSAFRGGRGDIWRNNRVIPYRH
jgi:hypothetical protein